MAFDEYDIYFAGTVMPDKDPAEVRRQIQALVKATPAQLEQLFSGTPVLIKTGVDMDTAAQYRLAFREAGALIDIKPTVSKNASAAPVVNDGAAVDNQTQPVNEKDASSWSLAPPRSGTLLDSVPQQTPAPIPDTSGLSLDLSDKPLDETPPPPTPEIDTADLTVTAPRTGSLEDCQPEVKPAVIPDISKLDLVDPKE